MATTTSTESNYTHISIVLDRSGSMHSTKGDTMGGFNEFLDSQKRDNEGKTTCSLITFSNDFTNVYSMVDLSKAEPLTDNNYITSGGTALFDAWGYEMTTLTSQIAKMSALKRPDRVLFAIITDGIENCSRHYTHKAIMDMVNSHSDWEFIYLGANQDAIKSSKKYGVGKDSSITYKQGAEREVYRCFSNAVSRYRKGDSKKVEFTKYERSLSMQPNPDNNAIDGNNADNTNVKRNLSC